MHRHVARSRLNHPYLSGTCSIFIYPCPILYCDNRWNLRNSERHLNSSCGIGQRDWCVPLSIICVLRPTEVYGSTVDSLSISVLVQVRGRIDAPTTPSVGLPKIGYGVLYVQIAD